MDVVVISAAKWGQNYEEVSHSHSLLWFNIILRWESLSDEQRDGGLVEYYMYVV